MRDAQRFGGARERQVTPHRLEASQRGQGQVSSIHVLGLKTHRGRREFVCRPVGAVIAFFDLLGAKAPDRSDAGIYSEHIPANKPMADRGEASSRWNRLS